MFNNEVQREGIHMHYLITGGTGFIGQALINDLNSQGHHVTVVTRQRLPDQSHCHFIARFDEIDTQQRFDAVVNLAGASLAGARWTEAYKKEIYSSRLDTTGDLVDLLRRLQSRPEVLLSASAIGYYGHHGDEALTESSEPAEGFSQRLCQQWEDAALQAEALGVRVCRLRLGVVLDGDGGAFPQMAGAFRFGVANWLGDGRQWLSWVHRRDVIGAIHFLQARHDLSGAFNITAPEAVTSRGFCLAMKQYKRTFITAPVPAPVMRLLVGEMAEELLLNGQRVLPARLQAAGFQFSFPDLHAALGDILGR